MGAETGNGGHITDQPSVAQTGATLIEELEELGRGQAGLPQDGGQGPPFDSAVLGDHNHPPVGTRRDFP
jgi:hypothetical protein